MTIRSPDRRRTGTPAARSTHTNPQRRLTTVGDSEISVHSDFRLVELDARPDQEDLCRLRAILRLTFTVPTDTFVTSNLPLLLTKLCAAHAVGERVTGSMKDDQHAD